VCSGSVARSKRPSSFFYFQLKNKRTQSKKTVLLFARAHRPALRRWTRLPFGHPPRLLHLVRHPLATPAFRLLLGAPLTLRAVYKAVRRSAGASAAPVFSVDRYGDATGTVAAPGPGGRGGMARAGARRPSDRTGLPPPIIDSNTNQLQ
jgi:hypothetical protein